MCPGLLNYYYSFHSVVPTFGGYQRFILIIAGIGDNKPSNANVRWDFILRRSILVRATSLELRYFYEICTTANLSQKVAIFLLQRKGPTA